MAVHSVEGGAGGVDLAGERRRRRPAVDLSGGRRWIWVEGLRDRGRWARQLVDAGSHDRPRTGRGEVVVAARGRREKRGG